MSLQMEVVHPHNDALYIVYKEKVTLVPTLIEILTLSK